MLKAVVATAAVAIGLALVADDAGAIFAKTAPSAINQLPQATKIATGYATEAPYAHQALCRTDPHVCEGGGAERITLTTESWDLLQKVNAAENAAILASSDFAIHGRTDVWTVGGQAGDCEDYALAKRRALIAAGLPASAMSVAVLRTPRGLGHAALVVRTDRGDFVLDNRHGEIVGWAQTEYRWYKITAPSDPRRWLAVTRAASA